MTPKDYETKIIALVRNRDYKGAHELVREALTTYPANLFFLKNEVFILYRTGKIKQARERAEERIEFLKDDPFFLKVYLSILEKQKATKDIDRIIENIFLSGIRGNEDLYLFLARLSERVFSRESAAEILKRSIHIFPEGRALKNHLDELSKGGSAESGYKNYKEKFRGRKVKDAIAEIEGIKALPNYSKDSELHLYLAELYKKAGEYEKAIGIYRYILSLKDSLFTRKMLGYAYYKTGDTENALVYLKDVFLKAPHDHYLYSAIYKIFKAGSDYEGFEKLILEALGLNPDAKHLYGLLKRAKKNFGQD